VAKVETGIKENDYDRQVRIMGIDNKEDIFKE
jgi:hypothetical protein